MPNDAKLGLVVGVGLTIAVAVVFFSKEPEANADRPAPAEVTGRGAGDSQGLLGREPIRPVGQVTGWQPQRQ